MKDPVAMICPECGARYASPQGLADRALCVPCDCPLSRINCDRCGCAIKYCLDGCHIGPDGYGGCEPSQDVADGPR